MVTGRDHLFDDESNDVKGVQRSSSKTPSAQCLWAWVFHRELGVNTMAPVPAEVEIDGPVSLEIGDEQGMNLAVEETPGRVDAAGPPRKGPPKAVCLREATT